MYDKEKSNPFIVPENYFEDFHKKLMEKLPAHHHTTTSLPMQPQKSRWQRWWSYAAIITLTLAIATATTLYLNMATESPTEISEAERNEMIETIFDNFPIDDYNIYCYLTSNDPNF